MTPPAADHSRRSIYVDLGAIVVLVVVAVMTLHAAQLYFSKKGEAIEEMKSSAVRSIVALERNVVGFILSYAPAEYEKLLASELERAGDFAIVVEDRKMGEALGIGTYVSGRIRDEAGEIIEYDPLNRAQNAALEACYFAHRNDITTPEGEVVGSIAIYISGEELIEELNAILRDSAVNAAGISALLVVLLFLSIRGHLLRPLSTMVRVVSSGDADGIPLRRLPDKGPREIQLLARRINGMIDAIDQSRDALRERHRDLQHEKQRLDNILEGTRAGTWEWNLHTGEAHFNERWAEIIGYTLEELAPVNIDTWRRFAHEEDLKRSAGLLEKHFSGELDYYECELRMRHRDGRWVWVLDRGKVTGRGEEGEPLWMAGTHTEITRRKDAEIALAEAKEQLELALWGSGDGWWDWDVVEGRAYFDARWNSMIGYQAGEIEGSFEAWKALLHPDDLENVLATLRTHLDGISPDYEVAFRMRTKSGEWKWILARGKVVKRDVDGRPLRMVGTHSDIDVAKRNEQALNEAKAEAERANHAKGEFLANMSHEIRTPMNAILGMTELLGERELDEEARHFVSIARAAGGTLLSIINDILDLSKIEAGQLKLENEPFDLTELVVSTTAMVGLRARERGITLDYDMVGEVPPWVSGDSLRLRQVLLNLLGNAVKFTERGHVRLTVVAVSDGVVEFRVEDSGVGIPAARLKEIFDSFTQAELSITRRYGGTGLGLTISRSLVEMMGGEIGVESSVGEGSTFHFTAQLAAATAVAPAKPKEHISTHRPLRILVAEDAEDNRLLLRAYLKGSPHQLTFAENGRLALELFQQRQPGDEPFDLVLMDVQMPEMDGLTATRAIRAWEEEQGVARTPVVALTAYALREEIERVMAAGFDRHLAKPVRKGRLLEAIAEHAKG